MAYETGIPGIPGLKSDGKGGVVIEGDVTATQHLDPDGNPIGGTSLPGVTSDGLTPGGMKVAGSITSLPVLPVPTVAPVLVAVDDAGGLPAGTYRVAYSWKESITGWTSPSPEASITLAQPGFIGATLPAYATGATSASFFRSKINDATGTLWYDDNADLDAPDVVSTLRSVDAALDTVLFAPFANTSQKNSVLGRTTFQGHVVMQGLVDLIALDSRANVVFSASFDPTGFSTSHGIGAYNATPPPAQPTMTLVTSTITDADAKATIQALIGIINGCGFAAITES